MPRRDGTGPAGMGPMTGRGMGRCAGYANAGFGGGRGRGCRRMYYMTGLPGWARYNAYPFHARQGAAPDVDEKAMLQNQADFLEKQLKEVRERLENLGKDE